MINFSVRGKTERMILRGKRVALRDVYEVLEFHKTPDINVKETDNMTIGQIAKRSGTARHKVYGILEELQNLGLIKMRPLSKRGLYQFVLVHYGDDYKEAMRGKNSEVVAFNGNSNDRSDVEAEQEEFLRSLGDIQ